MVRREPVGVCAQVTPWNYPLMMAIWKIAPALAAGNTVVLKPSDTTPVSTLLLAEVAAEFLPPGVLNVVCGDRDTGRALVSTRSRRWSRSPARSARAWRSPRPRRPASSASTWSWAARPPRSSSTTPTPTAARGHRGAGYFNAGQDCTAATRVLAEPRSHDDFVDALAGRRAGQTTGGRDDEDATSARSTTPGQLARVRGSSSGCPGTPRCWRAATGSATAATSSPRPSSPGCTRTTR